MLLLELIKELNSLKKEEIHERLCELLLLHENKQQEQNDKLKIIINEMKEKEDESDSDDEIQQIFDQAVITNSCCLPICISKCKDCDVKVDTTVDIAAT